MEWLEKIVEREPDAVSLAPRGASERRLRDAEKALGVSLPPVYVEFLRRWNGADLLGRILSVEEVLEWAEGSFSRFDRKVVLTGKTELGAYYAAKPRHWLVIATYDLMSEVHCFDTRNPSDWPVIEYDAALVKHEDRLERHPSFEAFLLDWVARDVEDPRSQRELEKIAKARRWHLGP